MRHSTSIAHTAITKFHMDGKLNLGQPTKYSRSPQMEFALTSYLIKMGYL